MNKHTASNFRDRFNEVIAQLEVEFDASITIGNISYNEGEGNLSTKLTLQEKSVRGKSAEEAVFATAAWRYGLTKSDYGRKFLMNGKTYKLVAFRTRAPKWCIIGEDENGDRFRFTKYVLNNLEV